MKGLPPPFGYGIANKLIFSKIKKTLGLEEATFLTYGAAPLKQTTVDFFASIDIILLNFYGMSESSAVTTFQDNNSFNLYSAGEKYPGTDLVIMN